MIIHLDTSFLVDALTGPRKRGSLLRSWFEKGDIILLSSPVLYEWLRGKRSQQELEDQEKLFPVKSTVSVDSQGAIRAAKIYKILKSPRGREIDILIAACAMEHGASLATLNPTDFEDIPGLILTPLST